MFADISDGKLPEQTLYITTPAYVKDFYGARLNMMDGYCFLYSAAIKELGLLNLSDEVNKPNAVILDSLRLVMFHSRIEFVEANKPFPNSNAGNIRYMIEGNEQQKNTATIKGWAFNIAKDNVKGDSVFLTLSSPLKSYIAPCIVNLRPDITPYFNKKYLDNAGFLNTIYKTNVAKGVYKLGLLIKDSTSTLLHETTDVVIRVNIPEFGTMIPLQTLPPAIETKGNLEHVDITDSTIYCSGWAFLENQDAHTSEISLVLIKDSAKYITAVSPVMRPEIDNYFKLNNDLTNSGFEITYKKADLPKGKYKAVAIITDKKTGKERSFPFLNEFEIK